MHEESKKHLKTFIRSFVAHYKKIKIENYNVPHELGSRTRNKPIDITVEKGATTKVT